MNTTGFPRCCTAVVLHSFGSATVEEIVADVKKMEKSSCKPKEYDLNGSWPMHDHAVIVATTTHRQTVANRGLRAAGFKSTRHMSKKGHPENKLILWHKPMMEK